MATYETFAAAGLEAQHDVGAVVLAGLALDGALPADVALPRVVSHNVISLIVQHFQYCLRSLYSTGMEESTPRNGNYLK